MNSQQPVTVICSFRVKADCTEQFEDLLARHYAVMLEAGLATDKPPIHFKGDDQGRGPHYVHIYEWVDDKAAGVAHNTPAVMAIWEPMGACVEARGDRPAMDFPHFRPLELQG